MARNFEQHMSGARAKKPPLQLLSVIMPARDEEGCGASTVEHLYVELRLQGVPHELSWRTMAARMQRGACSNPRRAVFLHLGRCRMPDCTALGVLSRAAWIT